jgi:hypothetical protein
MQMVVSGNQTDAIDPEPTLGRGRELQRLGDYC